MKEKDEIEVTEAEIQAGLEVLEGLLPCDWGYSELANGNREGLIEIIRAAKSAELHGK